MIAPPRTDPLVWIMAVPLAYATEQVEVAQILLGLLMSIPRPFVITVTGRE